MALNNPNVSMLNALFDRGMDATIFRVLVDGRSVKYILVSRVVYDSRNDSGMTPADFLRREMPPLPDGDWEGANVEWADGGPRVVRLLDDPLPGPPVPRWHPNVVSEMSLRQHDGEGLTPDDILATSPSLDGGRVVRVRRAVWTSSLSDMRAESDVYRFLARTDARIAPFLAHVRAGYGGHVFGFATAWLPGYRGARLAGVDDIEACRMALHTLHRNRVAVGTFSAYTFVMVMGRAYIQDLSQFSRATPDRCADEMANLHNALTGRFDLIESEYYSDED